jgi:hypothetical protein
MGAVRLRASLVAGILDDAVVIGATEHSRIRFS